MFKQKSDPAAASARLEPADAVRLARVKARQRLIGAIVLLGIGILGFPLVFETQPRPIPVDIPIEIPRREAMAPLAMPPARAPVTTGHAAFDPASTALMPGPAPAASASATSAVLPARTPQRASETVINESSADAGRELPAPKPAASAPHVAAKLPPPVASVAVASPSTSSDGDRARALLEGRATGATDEGRFVVQVGAFADAEAARETRKRVEKLGLKTYTQVANTPSGNRIRVRVGPFAARGEAESALAKAKAAGLTAVLLTL